MHGKTAAVYLRKPHMVESMKMNEVLPSAAFEGGPHSGRTKQGGLTADKKAAPGAANTGDGNEVEKVWPVSISHTIMIWG